MDLHDFDSVDELLMPENMKIDVSFNLKLNR